MTATVTASDVARVTSSKDHHLHMDPAPGGGPWPVSGLRRRQGASHGAPVARFDLPARRDLNRLTGERDLLRVVMTAR